MNGSVRLVGCKPSSSGVLLRLRRDCASSSDGELENVRRGNVREHSAQLLSKKAGEAKNVTTYIGPPQSAQRTAGLVFLLAEIVAVKT